MPRKTEVYIVLELRVEGSGTVRREIFADRLTFESGDLVIWDRDQVEFRCPISTVLFVAFEPEKNLYIAAARRNRGRASTRWTAADEARLIELDEADEPVESIARILERNEGAIRVRLMRLRGGR